MVWNGTLQYGMVWYGVVWYGMVWSGMVWYGLVWSGMVWYGMVWYGMVWYGMVWSGTLVWYGLVWYGLVWYGMVWYGMVWFLSRMGYITDKCTTPFLHGDRLLSSVHARMRNNCSNLKCDLFVNHLSETNLCEYCNVPENANHYFLHCTGLRLQMFHSTRMECWAKH